MRRGREGEGKGSGGGERKGGGGVGLGEGGGAEGEEQEGPRHRPGSAFEGHRRHSFVSPSPRRAGYTGSREGWFRGWAGGRGGSRPEGSLGGLRGNT